MKKRALTICGSSYKSGKVMVTSGSCTLKATAESEKWIIPHKFVNDEFVSFLSCLLPLDEGSQAVKRRPIKGEGSLQELTNDFQLLILHSIDLVDILRLFKKLGLAGIHEKENYIQYFTQDISRLSAEIRAKLDNELFSAPSCQNI
jgi:hypothetical protein